MGERHLFDFTGPEVVHQTVVDSAVVDEERFPLPTIELEYDDGEDEERPCDLCGGDLDLNEFHVCRDCSGLARCPDDICHGLGYCMHVWGDIGP